MADKVKKLKDKGLVKDVDANQTTAINALTDSEVDLLIAFKEYLEDKGFKAEPLDKGQSVVVL